MSGAVCVFVSVLAVPATAGLAVAIAELVDARQRRKRQRQYELEGRRAQAAKLCDESGFPNPWERT